VEASRKAVEENARWSSRPQTKGSRSVPSGKKPAELQWLYNDSKTFQPSLMNQKETTSDTISMVLRVRSGAMAAAEYRENLQRGDGRSPESAFSKAVTHDACLTHGRKRNSTLLHKFEVPDPFACTSAHGTASFGACRTVLTGFTDETRSGG